MSFTQESILFIILIKILINQMSKIKNIDIYVGTVGSAYVDKETALKNKKDAEINITDVEKIIVRANALKLALETSVVNSQLAESSAQGILNRLNAAIQEWQSRDISKYLQLVELKNDLLANDTDGLYNNGGNVITASSNSQNATNQIAAINDIIAAAEVLLEDNRKLALIRANEYDDAVNKFAQYIPDYEADPNELSNNAENELNERIDEVNDNLNIINDTTEAVNNTTTEVGQLIDAIIAGENSDTPVDPSGNVYYWYVGQKLPEAEGLVSTADSFVITEKTVNSWHEVKVVKMGNGEDVVSLLFGSISSMSTLKTWYVIVPEELQFTPVMSDLASIDTRFTKLNTGFYTVDGKSYVCYQVNNDIPVVEEDESVLNIILTTAVVDAPEEQTTGNYWYVGNTTPSLPYIKTAEIISNTGDTESLGWRKIEGDLATYGINNPYADNFAIPVYDYPLYVIVPQGTKFKDGLGETSLGSVFDTIMINNIPYSVYKFDEGEILEFNLSLYFEGTVTPVEPTGETEPVGPTGETGTTGETQPSEPKNYYVYIGLTEPTAATIIGDELAESNDDTGWHLIGTTLTSPLWAPTADGIVLNENYEDVDFYIAAPGNFGVYDGLGTSVAYQSLGNVQIDGVTYNVVKGAAAEFAFTIR